MMYADVASFDRYRNELRRIEALEADEEHRLARAWAAGDAAAGARLIESNLPFVLRIAREYRRWGIPFEDLVQQGNLGLLKAAVKFDPEKCCRLVTYAAYWIRAEIREYVVRGYRIVRLGTTRSERRAMRAFRRRPIATVEALATESGMPIARAYQIWPLLAQGDLALDRSYGDGSTAMERLESTDRGPEELVARARTLSAVRKALAEALAALSEREQRIVRARMMSDEPPTLEQLGVEMGVSKERVRQLEARVKAKLQAKLSEFRPAA